MITVEPKRDEESGAFQNGELVVDPQSFKVLPGKKIKRRPDEARARALMKYADALIEKFLETK